MDHRLFQCLAVAIHPLHFDDRLLPRYSTDWRLEIAKYLVLSACSSPIAVVDVDGLLVVLFFPLSRSRDLKLEA
jgi:hypothetical protein